METCVGVDFDVFVQVCLVLRFPFFDFPFLCLLICILLTLLVCFFVCLFHVGCGDLFIALGLHIDRSVAVAILLLFLL